MRKLWTFSLIGMFSLCITTVAEAKVCFLPNVLIGGKCVSLSKAKYNDCKGFTETVNCETVGKAIIDTCRTEDGKTYYKCGCRGDVISWDVIKEHPGWLCEYGYDDGCGCSAEHIFCSSEYKYRGDGTGKCAKSDENENSRGVGACALPNGRVYYKDCNCNGYPYECDSLTGLKAPTGVNDSSVGCLSPHSSNYKYKECECADGWTSGSCESNTNGCLMPVSYVTANDGELTCALCDERICKSNGESNLETVYCAPKNENGGNAFGGEYLTRTITDCLDLGFVQGATGGFCPAGTQKAGETGVKCPFNGNYMFCEDQPGCYPTQEACEYDISVKTCQYIGGCYRVAECSEGHELNKDKTACVVAECAEGFTTEELDCNDAEHGLMHGYNGDDYQEGKSGAKECKQCECDIAAARAAGYCKYTNNPADTDGTAAGEGILSVPCCDGSYSECRFDIGTTTPSEGTATHEIHEACGQKYYVATSCLEGYEPVKGRCESKSCATGYTTTVQSVNDCFDSSESYKGAMGWSIKAQEENDEVVQSGGKTCYQCSCDASDCKWVSTPPDPNSDLKYKGQFGVLSKETACCDGSNKACKANLCTDNSTDDLTDDNDPTNDCIPSSASGELCKSEHNHAISLKQYTACGQTRCLINECEQDYKPSDDRLSCVFAGDCSSEGLRLKPDHSGCECDADNYWASDPNAACESRGYQYRDTNTCVKDGALYSISYNTDHSCLQADTTPSSCKDKDGYAFDGNGGCIMCNSSKGSFAIKKECEDTSHKTCSATQYADGKTGCYTPTGECVSGYAQSYLSPGFCCLNDGTTFAQIADCVDTTSTSVEEYVEEDGMYYTYYIPSSNEYGYKCVSEVSYYIGERDVRCLKRVEGACAQGLIYVNGNCVECNYKYTESNKPANSTLLGGSCTINGTTYRESFICKPGYEYIPKTNKCEQKFSVTVHLMDLEYVNGDTGCEGYNEQHQFEDDFINSGNRFEYVSNNTAVCDWNTPSYASVYEGSYDNQRVKTDVNTFDFTIEGTLSNDSTREVGVEILVNVNVCAKESDDGYVDWAACEGSKSFTLCKKVTLSKQGNVFNVLEATLDIPVTSWDYDETCDF